MINLVTSIAFAVCAGGLYKLVLKFIAPAVKGERKKISSLADEFSKINDNLKKKIESSIKQRASVNVSSDKMLKEAHDESKKMLDYSSYDVAKIAESILIKGEKQIGIQIDEETDALVNIILEATKITVAEMILHHHRAAGDQVVSKVSALIENQER